MLAPLDAAAPSSLSTMTLKTLVLCNHPSWEEAWRNALKRAGIEDCRRHDLRHTFAPEGLQAAARLDNLVAVRGCHKTKAPNHDS